MTIQACSSNTDGCPSHCISSSFPSLLDIAQASCEKRCSPSFEVSYVFIQNCPKTPRINSKTPPHQCWGSFCQLMDFSFIEGSGSHRTHRQTIFATARTCASQHPLDFTVTLLRRSTQSGADLFCNSRIRHTRWHWLSPRPGMCCQQDI